MILSGLKETFIKRCIDVRTNKAEIRPKNRVRKRRVVGRIYGMKYSWKGHKDRNRHKSRIKRSGQARLVYVEEDINRNIPTTWRWEIFVADTYYTVFAFVFLESWFHRRSVVLVPAEVRLLEAGTVTASHGHVSSRWWWWWKNGCGFHGLPQIL